MFVYNGLTMTYTRGQNYLADNKHSQQSELCVWLKTLLYICGKKLNWISSVIKNRAKTPELLSYPDSHSLQH